MSPVATRLTTKGQVVIPKAIRSRLGWQPGSVLEVTVTASGKAVTLRRAAPGKRANAAWLDEVAGAVKKGDPVGDLEAAHRREVEKDARRRP